MQVFSMRAKSQTDADRFLAAARQSGVLMMNVSVQPDLPFADVELEFATIASAKRLDELVVEATGSTLMRRTLRPVSREENCMTYSVGFAFAV